MEHQCLGAECGVVLMIPCTAQQQQHAENKRILDEWAQTETFAEQQKAEIEQLRAENERTQEWLDRFQGELAAKQIELLEAKAEMSVRIERMEAILVLLCEQATQGQGQMGAPFQQFIDDWQREHRG